MIVSVCADKGSPGATTLAAVLGLVWPGPRVVLEADTAGSDLSFRLRPAPGRGSLGGRLAPDPSVAGLATAARMGLTEAGPLPYAQDTSLGVPVVPGVLSAERFRALRSLWPQVAGGLSAWHGTAIADMGRLTSDHAALPLARASTVVLLLTPATLEGLYHVRDRVAELSGTLGDPTRTRSTLAVVVKGELRDRRSAVEQVRQLLASIGSPASVIGFVAHDPVGARGLWAGELTRRFAGSDLVRSVRSTAEAVLAGWPELAALPAPGDEGDGKGGMDRAGAPGDVAASVGTVMEGTRS
ncbi:hypothetical protein ACVBEQ_08155 [Nakamurella sp. GG22]